MARLALESRAPVVPCAMIDTFEFLPPGSLHPQLKIRPGVIFGQPMEFSRYYGKETDRAALRAVTDEIIAEIAQAVRPGVCHRSMRRRRRSNCRRQSRQ